jgi:hypothetical protein
MRHHASFAPDPRGCSTVKLSQDPDGRFWRSPNKRKVRPKEGKDDQTTFSGDHAIGLFVYFGHTGDAEAFKRWIQWIGVNERCMTFCGPMPHGTPRYCLDDRCTFRPGDCQVLLLLGDKLDVPVEQALLDPAHYRVGFAPRMAKQPSFLTGLYLQAGHRTPRGRHPN